jgi:hypothetical protein
MCFDHEIISKFSLAQNQAKDPKGSSARRYFVDPEFKHGITRMHR